MSKLSPGKLSNPETFSAREIFRECPVTQLAYDRLKVRIAQGIVQGVAARVEDDRHRVLLVRQHRENGWSRQWMTPGGGVEPRETPQRAIHREIHEEAGVRVQGLRLWKVYRNSYTSPKQGDSPLRFDILQYVAQWRSGKPRSLVPEEISEVRWFHRLPRDMAFREDWLYRCPPVRAKPLINQPR